MVRIGNSHAKNSLHLVDISYVFCDSVNTFLWPNLTSLIQQVPKEYVQYWNIQRMHIVKVC